MIDVRGETWAGPRPAERARSVLRCLLDVTTQRGVMLNPPAKHFASASLNLVGRDASLRTA
jgi:hypothetical protein